MTIWLFPILVFLILIFIFCFFRISIRRDYTKELPDDDESPLAYDKVSRWLLFDIIRYITIRQLNRLHPVGNLLNAGCGPGYLDIAIARKYPEVKITGLDLSEKMLELAHLNLSLRDKNLPISFKLGDVQSLPFDDNSFEIAISSLSLHHWQDSRRSLSEIYRVLKPGGQFLIFDLRRDTPYILFYVFILGQRFLAPLPIRRVNGAVGSIWSAYTPKEMRKLLSDLPLSGSRVFRGWGWAYLWGRK
jgi:ubiquinone/menaquinone biosynthesis C-methylase UbiE